VETMKFEDKTIECALCHDTFIWKAGEQQYYYDNNLSQPKRCASCRAYLRRKINRQQSERREEVGHGHQ